MSLYLFAFPAAVGLIIAGLAVSIISFGLLWQQRTVRAGHLLAVSLWLTIWGAVINLGRLPVGAATIFALSIAIAYIWAAMRGLANESSEVALETDWLKQLAGRVDDMLWLISAESGTPLYVSPAYMQLTGKQSIDLYDNPNAWREMVHPDDAEAFSERFNMRDSAEKSIHYRIINANGESRWVRSHIWPQQDEKGQISAFAGVTTDITHEMQQASMPQQDVQQRLGALASGFANDFNSTLFSLMGQASLAKAKLADGHPAREHLERMLSTSNGAKQITQQMLTYAGEAPMETKRLNANLLVQDNRKALKRAIPRGVVLQTSLSRFLPMIEADESQIVLVLENLIANAVEAGARKIIISTAVETGLDADSAEYQHFGEPLTPDEYVTLTITDDGSGVDHNTLAQLFEPYFTTKPEGIGLGLSTALGIVRAHNGAIQVQAGRTNGAAFKLFIPISRKESVQANNMNYVMDSPPTHISSQVMIIDDEDTVTEVVADLLELEGISTLTSNDGSAAVELYQRRQNEIGLVILDLTMPGMSGREVFNALRKINPEVNVLISSGYGRKEVSRHIEPEALAGIIQKPFDVFTLVSEIRSHL